MQFDRAEPSPLNHFKEEHAALMADSYRLLTGRELARAQLTPAQCAHELYHAPFALLAHDTAEEPIFFYANLTAQDLFEMPWRQFSSTPSRQSAELGDQAERARLFERVSRDGFIDDYSGVRISRTGRRFRIARAVVWNLCAANEDPVGQAALFSEWEFL